MKDFSDYTGFECKIGDLYDKIREESSMERKRPAMTTDTVAEYLSEGIASGKWKPGEKLPSEVQLCSLLGASRVTVRSAIGRLTGLGLVQSRQGKGTYVCEPIMSYEIPVLSIQSADWLSIFEFRKIIESESAALAAIRATAAEVRELGDSLVGMERGESLQEVADYDMRFHEIVARVSGNELIYQVFQMMRETYNRMFRDNVNRVGKAGIEDHRHILLAIQTRDMDAARRNMLKHLDDTIRSVSK